VVSPASFLPVRFWDFQLDLRTGELRRDGIDLKLQPQPAKVLALLVSRPGEVVTREELANHVWGSDTHVAFDGGLNFAIRQIRAALQDDSDAPRFIETLPKRGYRFVAPVTQDSAVATTPPVTPPAPAQNEPKRGFRYGLAALMVIAVIALGLELHRLAAPKPASASGISSIAVLPLRNLSRDPDQEYFSEGMTDELTTDLAKLDRLKVISHTSVQRYNQSKLSLQEIAKELHADAVIEGTVMRSGDRVRITAQLIDARTDQHLWAEKYERDFRDILTLQSEVAEQIATQVGMNLTVGERARLARTPVVDPAAHEAYLRGRFFAYKLNCTGFKQSLQNYEQAEARDPAFVQAYVGIADSYFHLGDWGCSPQGDSFAKARVAALKALELDPAAAEAYAQLANLDFTAEWNWAKAEQEYTQALQLDPNDAEIHSAYAIFLAAMGRPAQALAEMKKAHDLDPVSEATNMLDTYVLYLTRQYDPAIEQGKKTLDLYPNSRATNYWMGQIYEQKQMPKEAFDQYLKSNSGTLADFVKLRLAFEKGGLPGFWRQEFSHSEENPDWPCWKTMFYGHIGDKERTMELLQQSYEHHCDGLQFLKTNPVFDPLRDDSRYKSLIAQLKL
jgi:TolB-like protein/DNA-binding winged helix-turn-helix (wHTH) protein/tetratricopeptide (TPR) repeat protein